MVEHLERQVYLVITKKKGVDSVYVRNDLYAPVEIELSFAGLTERQRCAEPSDPSGHAGAQQHSSRAAHGHEHSTAAGVRAEVRILPGRPLRARPWPIDTRSPGVAGRSG